MSRQNGSNGKEGQPQAPRIRHGGPGAMGAIEKPKDAKGTLRRLLSYLGEYRLLLVIVTVLTIGSTLLNLAGPYLQGVAIDQFIIGG